MKRFFCDQPLHQTIELNSALSHRLKHVLRLPLNSIFELFNHTQMATVKLIAWQKKMALCQCLQHSRISENNRIEIQLIQCISKTHKMELTIQKCTELGITSIQPLYSDHSAVKKQTVFDEKKTHHWQQIAIHACEQSKRLHIPHILPTQTFNHWLNNSMIKPNTLALVCHPKQRNTWKKPIDIDAAMLIIGPEGGLSDTEVQNALGKGFLLAQFGQNILRTETAAIVALTWLQTHYGDMAPC